MKKTLKIFIGFIIFIFALLIAIPLFFKEDIKAMIIAEFEKQVEASLYFDNVNLTLLRDFPDFTLKVSQMGIVGKGVFSEDTLFQAKSFTMALDLKEVLFGDQLNIKSVGADEAFIEILVLADGKANYDIAKPTAPDQAETPSSDDAIVFGLESINIENSNFIYYDASMPFYTVLSGINLKGEGAFATDIFDLSTRGKINDVIVNYENTSYITQKSLSIDATIAMDLLQNKYTFKDNRISINTFPLTADGYFTLLEEGYDMDIQFNAPGASFKELLSLVPGVYSNAFESLEAEGTVSFNGYVKGIYNEAGDMPAFGLNAAVSDGLFHYAGLPESIKNVDLDLSINNADGRIENTSLDINKLHLEFGNNPLDARLEIKNFRSFDVDAELKTALDLSQLKNYYPLDGYNMEGNLTVDASAIGRYDSLKKQVPKLNIIVRWEDGLLQTPEISEPITNIQLNTFIINFTEQLRDTEISITPFQMELADQPFQMRALLNDPENIKWDVAAQGRINLDKVLELLPMEGIVLKGLVDASIESKGDMESVKRDNYKNLPSSGTIKVSNFNYQSVDFDKTISISKANATLNNDRIEVENLEGKAGETNFELEGFLYNYLGYALNNEKLQGELTAKADALNINEWYVPVETETSSEEDTALEVVRLPENIDFTTSVNMGSITYNQLTMNDFQSKVNISEGIARLQNTSFQALNGRVGLTGQYDSKPEKPVFDFNFNAQEISIPQSFQSISMIKSFAPIAKVMSGNFNTNFSVNGFLTSEMMPEMSSLSGKGLIEVLQASLGETELLSGLSGVTKLNNLTTTLNQLKMSAEIKEGRLFVKPFDVTLGRYKTQVSGSSGIDGSIDYSLKMEVPAGAVGQQVNSLITSLTGNNNSFAGENLIMDIGMTGVFTKPDFSLKGIYTQNGNSVKNTVQATASEQINKKKEELKTQVSNKVETGKDSAKALLKTKQDSLQGRIDTLINAQKDSISAKALEKLGLKKDSSKVDKAKEKVEGILKGVFGKKKKKKNKEGEGGGNI